MNGLLNFFLHFIFIATFLFLIVVSFIILRPFRVHRTRTISTMSLKFSYLLYLIVFITLVYLILFFSDIPAENEVWADDWLMKICYTVIIISFFVPNIAIMFRRKVKKLRQAYNILFTGINAIITIALLLVMRCFPFRF